MTGPQKCTNQTPFTSAGIRLDVEGTYHTKREVAGKSSTQKCRLGWDMGQFSGGYK